MLNYIQQQNGSNYKVVMMVVIGSGDGGGGVGGVSVGFGWCFR